MKNIAWSVSSDRSSTDSMGYRTRNKKDVESDEDDTPYNIVTYNQSGKNDDWDEEYMMGILDCFEKFQKIYLDTGNFFDKSERYNLFNQQVIECIFKYHRFVETKDAKRKVEVLLD
jgi:hypothetical protein